MNTHIMNHRFTDCAAYTCTSIHLHIHTLILEVCSHIGYTCTLMRGIMIMIYLHTYCYCNTYTPLYDVHILPC